MTKPVPRQPAQGVEPSTQSASSTEPSTNPVRSTLSGNTDMVELVEWFVGYLGERTDELRQAWSTRDLLRLSVIAHQLKGSSAGYGFASLGIAAGKLEQTTKAHIETESDLEAVQASLESLIDLCSRVST